MIRPLLPTDAAELAELYRANREFLAPFEPARPDDFYTARGQRQRLKAQKASGLQTSSHQVRPRGPLICEQTMLMRLWWNSSPR